MFIFPPVNYRQANLFRRETSIPFSCVSHSDHHNRQHCKSSFSVKMDISLQTHRSYVNRPICNLPTPALVLSRPLIENNIKRLHNDVSQLGISFRPHVKTLKVSISIALSVQGYEMTPFAQSIQVTRMMLEGGKHRKIVASTVCEIEGALPLVAEGVLDEVRILYVPNCTAELVSSLSLVSLRAARHRQCPPTSCEDQTINQNPAYGR